MACDVLTTGRKSACYGNVAGIKAVYFADYGTLGEITYNVTDTDVIETLGGAPEFFEYDLKGTANTYTETITKSIDNGTAYFAQSLNVQFTKLTKEMHKELKLIVYASPHVIIEDYNGNFFLMGLQNGADATGGTIVTGGARGDFAGYTLVMTAEESTPANFLDSTIEATTATVSAVQEAP